MIRYPSWFDFPMACLGALVSGAIVAWVNSEHGFLPALTAALKQALYAFFATGLILQFSRWLATRPVQRFLALAMAVVIPLLITISLLLVVHSLKGTPEPFYSVIPGTILSLMGLLLVTWQSVRATGSPVAQPGLARKSIVEDS
jgi:hypothetical protein